MFSNLCLVERDVSGGECAKCAAISFVQKWSKNNNSNKKKTAAEKRSMAGHLPSNAYSCG